MFRRRLWQLAALWAAGVGSAAADEVVLDPDVFLRQAFGGHPPTPQVVWIDHAAQSQLTPILGHPFGQARVRYWRDGERTVWVLEEIGKEFPITAGFVVDDHQIQQAQLLIYRETRGEEIKFPSFLKQFIGARLAGDRLSNDIDGISGATLSVWAMEKMARAALTLDALATAS